MIRVYAYVVAGLAVSLLAAYAAGIEGLYVFIYLTPLFWPVVATPLILAVIASLVAHRISRPMAHLLFWAYASCMGLSFAGLFDAYAWPELMLALVAIGAIFVSATCYGYLTIRDLRPISKILLAGLLLTFALSILAAFIDSDALAGMAALLGAFVMAGLVACDTQHIKQRLIVVTRSNRIEVGREEIVGALMLFLDLTIVSPGLARLVGFTASRWTNLGRLTTLALDEAEHIEED